MFRHKQEAIIQSSEIDGEPPLPRYPGVARKVDPERVWVGYRPGGKSVVGHSPVSTGKRRLLHLQERCRPKTLSSTSRTKMTTVSDGHSEGPERFLSVAWPTGVQILVFFCSSVPVVLFDTPGITRLNNPRDLQVSVATGFCRVLIFVSS